MARCYESQDYLDERYLFILAARDHYKSVLNTIALPLWEVCKDPNITIAVLSFQRDKSISQLMSVKQIAEQNELLKAAWSDIFFAKKQDANKWNLYSGLYVKRTSTVKEATFSAWGLIENSPVSMHFDVLIVDDPVTIDNSATTEQIEKVKAAYRMLAGLGTRRVRIRTITTRYDVNDISADILKDGRYKKVIIPGEVDKDGNGKIGGIPVFKTREELDNIREDFGDAFYCGQILQDPTASNERGLDLEWLTYYDTLPSNLTYYLLCDPAGKKHKTSDSTVMAIIGCSPQRQFYLVDMIRDKLDVYERFQMLKDLYMKHDPYDCYYEVQALNSDLEVFDREMEREKFYFLISKFSSNVNDSKRKRIMALGALMRKRNFLIPRELYYTDVTGVERELISEFINEEYTKFPHNKAHDDMLDCMGMIQNVDVVFPEEAEEAPEKTAAARNAAPFRRQERDATWQSSFVW
jgi:phage terminase large subunit-like protein